MKLPLDTDSGAARARRAALSRWEAEGGAGPKPGALPGRTEAEALRLRVIALERLVIALLVDASERQRTQAAEMVELLTRR